MQGKVSYVRVWEYEATRTNVHEIIRAVQSLYTHTSSDVECSTSLSIDIDNQKKSTGQRGVVRLLPLFLLVAFATTIFVVVGQIQRQRQEAL